LTGSAQIWGDYGVGGCEFGDQRQPHMAGFGVTMQEDHWIALTGGQIVESGAVDVCEAAVRGLRGFGSAILCEGACDSLFHILQAGNGTASSRSRKVAFSVSSPGGAGRSTNRRNSPLCGRACQEYHSRPTTKLPILLRM